MFAAKFDRELFRIACAAVGVALVLLAIYVGCYFALSKPDNTAHELGVNTTYRVFQSPTLTTIFHPMAKIEGLATGREVGLISPRQAVLWDAVESGTYLR
jgi:hypothetical protein